MGTTTKKSPPTTLPKMMRTAAIRIAHDDSQQSRAEEGDDRIPVSLSSEEPVERWWGFEILDHSPEAVDLRRAERGLPLIDNHNTYSTVMRQLGVIEDVKIENGVVRGMMRFSQRPDAQLIRQDVLDGIITSMSIGYYIHELVLEKSTDEADTYRATKWELRKGSLVCVPADTTVGVGRSADQDAVPVRIRTLEAAPKGQEDAVSVTTPAQSGPQVTVGNDRDAAMESMRAIAELAKSHKLEHKLPEWIAQGRTVDQVKDEILEGVRAGTAMIRTPVVELTPKEQKEYSLCRAIVAASERDWSIAPFEREVSQDIERKLPAGYQRRGGTSFFMPSSISILPFDPAAARAHGGAHLRTAISAGGTGTGAETVFTEAGSFIELLRARMKVRELGASVLSGLNGPIAFPKQTGAGSFAWLGESGQVTESNLTTAQVALNPTTGRARQAYTKQLLAQSSLDVEMLVRMDLATIVALGIDLACIAGSGSSNQPTGILNTAGIGSVAIGTDGGVPTYDHMVDLETEIAVDNADIGTMAYLTTPGIRGKLKKTQMFSSTNGMPVWTGGREGEVNGYRADVSTQVPSNLTKGAAAGVCHAVLFGAWSNLIIGEWGVLEIQADPFTRGDYAEIVLRAFQMVGLCVRYPEAFAAIKDAKLS